MTRKGLPNTMFMVILIIVLAGIVGYIRWIKKPIEKMTQTYTNTALGFSITYPVTWLDHESLAIPDSKASEIFLAPENPDTLCYIIAPVTLARYINIRGEAGSLSENRKRLNSKHGGQDYTESTMVLAGENVFVYTGNPSCPDGSPQLFMTILVPHGDKVLSITTDRYHLPEVKDAILSLQLIP